MTPTTSESTPKNAASNAFLPNELVTIQGRQYPVVGGRLRLAHDAGLRGITTEIVQYDGAKAVIKATVFLGAADDQRPFNGYGEADSTRDKKLALAVLELAETRAIARALRFAGFGTEYTGAEEMPRDGDAEDRQAPKVPSPAPSKSLPNTSSSTATQAAPHPSAPFSATRTTAAPRTNASPNAVPPVCENCGVTVTPKVMEFSLNKYGSVYCFNHQNR